MIRKNKKFIDPRYFMDEKLELNEETGDEVMKQIIMEELNEETGDEVMKSLEDQYGPSNRSQVDAQFTQDVADFEHIVTAISHAYGNERVRDVATELVRMVLDPPTGPGEY